MKSKYASALIYIMTEDSHFTPSLSVPSHLKLLSVAEVFLYFTSIRQDVIKMWLLLFSAGGYHRVSAE